MRVEPNPDTYKPPVPYPQALSKPKAKVSDTDDHLLEAFQKVTITIPLVNAIKHIPFYAKFLTSKCTPHRSPKRTQLSENISSIMMNYLPIKKRDLEAPMINSEIGGMTFTRSLLDTGTSINILPKVAFPYRIMFSGWIGKEASWHSRRCDCKNRRMLFFGRLPSSRYEDH